MAVFTSRFNLFFTHLPTRYLAALVISLPILVWLWTLDRYALDVVHDDDYVLLRFVSRWISSGQNWASRVQDLVALHNTHRIVYDRLAALGMYYCLGRIDIRLMIWLGNMALLGIGWQFWRSYRSMAWPVWYFLPLPCWLFSLQSHENMFWGMAALQNFTVIWLMLETLHQLNRRVWLGWPMLLGVAATLTSGNGMLIFPIGAVLLITQPGRGRELGLWLAAMAVVVGLILSLAPMTEPHTPFMSWLPNVCLLLGAAFTNSATTTWPMVGGIILAGALGLSGLSWFARRGWLGQRLWQAAPTREWLMIGLMVLITALLLAIHRLPTEILRDRYKIYAHLTLCVVYLLGLVMAGPRWRAGLAAGAVFIAVIMNAGAYLACLPTVITGFQDRQADAANFRQYGTTLAPPYWRHSVDSLLQQVQTQGIYRFPDTFGNPAQWEVSPLPDALLINTSLIPEVGSIYIGKKPLIVQLKNQQLRRQLSDDTDRGIYLVVELIDKRRFILAAPPFGAGVRRWLKGEGLFLPGFITRFLSSRLGAGRYRVKVLRATAAGNTLLDTGQVVLVPGT